jgi:hypothetical protein
VNIASSSVLIRLRRKRALWVLLVASMILNLGFSTLCMAAHPILDVASSVDTTLQTSPVDDMTGDMAGNLLSDLLHGDAGDAHRSCEHSVPLVIVPAEQAPHLRPQVEFAPIPPARIPSMAGSMLRPPIA